MRQIFSSKEWKRSFSFFQWTVVICLHTRFIETYFVAHTIIFIETYLNGEKYPKYKNYEEIKVICSNFQTKYGIQQFMWKRMDPL